MEEKTSNAKTSLVGIIDNSNLDVLKNSTQAIEDENEFEAFFVTYKSEGNAITGLLDKECGSVVVNSVLHDTSFFLNQGLALATGDPIVFFQDLDSTLLKRIVEALSALYSPNVGAIIFTHPKNDNLLSLAEFFKQSFFIIPRRIFDVLGYFKGKDVESAYIDYLSRLKVLGYTYSIFPSSKKIKETLETEIEARKKGYLEGEHSLYYEHCFYRDHIKKEKIKLLSLTSVVYNRLEFFKQTVEKLFEATPELSSIPYEFIVVENHSEESEVRNWLLSQEFNTIVFNTNNLGPAPGRNQGLLLSRGDPILQIDPDLLLPKGWLGRVLDILSLPRVGVTGISAEETDYHILNVDNVEVEVKPGNIGGCWVIPRRTMEILGHFCEEYELYGGEDSDYGTRIMLSGLLNTYVPNLKCIHLGAVDSALSSQETPYVKMKRELFSKNMALYQKRAEAYQKGELSLVYKRYKYRF